MAAQKFTNVDKLFLNKCTLVQQLSQYNLTKLFLMKFKTSKCYKSHLTEKSKQNFWLTQYILNLKKNYLWEKREKEREENIGCLLHALNRGSDLQLRHVS